MRTQSSVYRCLSSLVIFSVVAVASSSVADGQETHNPGEINSNNALKLKLVRCPAGTFTMGSPTTEAERDEEEAQVQVTLSKGFWIGQTSVTQAQFKRVMFAEPWKGQAGVQEGDDDPASYTNSNDAANFCQSLTQTESQAGRLPNGWTYDVPTEAQREYACRAGTTTAYCFGDDPSRLSDYAWWSSGSQGDALSEPYAHIGAMKKPNAWGLYDMHGNEWEWCRDYYRNKLTGGTDRFVQRRHRQERKERASRRQLQQRRLQLPECNPHRPAARDPQSPLRLPRCLGSIELTVCSKSPGTVPVLRSLRSIMGTILLALEFLKRVPVNSRIEGKIMFRLFRLNSALAMCIAVAMLNSGLACSSQSAKSSSEVAQASSSPGTNAADAPAAPAAPPTSPPASPSSTADKVHGQSCRHVENAARRKDRYHRQGSGRGRGRQLRLHGGARRFESQRSAASHHARGNYRGKIAGRGGSVVRSDASHEADGQDQTAEAVVWVRPWLKGDDKIKLTSWKFADKK